MALAVLIVASLSVVFLGAGVIVGTLAKTKKDKDIGATLTVIGVFIALTLLFATP